MPALFSPPVGRRARRRSGAVLTALLALCLLAGCGQKGALYLPGEAGPATNGRDAGPAPVETPPANTGAAPATTPEPAAAASEEGAQHAA